MSVLPQVRSVLTTDLESVVAIDVEALVSSGPRLASDSPLEAFDRLCVVRRSQLEGELARPGSVVRLAEETRVLGYLLAWHVVDEIHLHNVAVASQARRRGIARALLHDLLAVARERRVARILLEVRPSNEPASQLYRSLGFEVFHRRSAYYDDGEDALEMHLDVR